MSFFELFVTIVLRFCYNSVVSNDNKFCTWITIYRFMGNDALVLDESLFLGKGSKRICYRHPEDASKCIKIDLNEKRKVTPKELKYYQRYARKGIRFDLIAPYYGEVMTNGGKGYMFGLAYDYNGKISKNIKYYLKTCRNEQVLDSLFLGLLGLKKFMVSYGIMVMELGYENMIYQQITPYSGNVIFIDGIGNNQFLPSANYLRIHARRVIRRKWFKFEKRLMDKYRDVPSIYKRFKMLDEARV